MEGACIVTHLFLCTDEMDERMFIDLVVEQLAGIVERWAISRMELQNFIEEFLGCVQLVGLKCRVIHAHDLKVP